MSEEKFKPNAVFTPSSVMDLEKFTKSQNPVVHAILATVDQLNQTLAINGAHLKIRFVNQIDERTPCNVDRNKFYFEIVRWEKE